MKRFFLFSAMLLSLFLLCSCDTDEYKPVESTAEESRVVMTLSLDGKKYEIKYELYRMLFLGNKDSVTGGDDSLLSGADKDEYIAKIDEIVKRRSSEIFAVFSIASELGIDPYSKDIDSAVADAVKADVERGGESGREAYEKYLERQKKLNMNYSVSTLMYRYGILYSEIEAYYQGKSDGVSGRIEKTFEFTENDLREYYFGDDCARYFQVYFIKGTSARPMQEHRDNIAALVGDSEVASYIISKTTADASEIIDPATKEITGSVAGRYEFDPAIYEKYTSTLFSLSAGQTSQVIELTDSDGEIYQYVLYSLPKDAAHLESCLDSVEESYRMNFFGKTSGARVDSLIGSAELTSAYDSIIHSEISMR